MEYTASERPPLGLTCSNGDGKLQKQHPPRPSSAICRSRPASASVPMEGTQMKRRPMSATSMRGATRPTSATRGTTRPRSALAGVAAARNRSSASVVRLIRSVEKGDTAAPALLYECLKIAKEVFDSGNTSMAWTIAPILRVAVQQLSKEVEGRLTLEVEVGILKEKEKLYDQGLKREALSVRLAKERAEEHVSACHESSTAMRHESEQLRSQVAGLKQSLDTLSWRLEKGLAAEQETRAKQRRILQAELDSLTLRIQSLQQQADVGKQIAAEKLSVAAKKEKLSTLEPDAERQTDLATKLRQRDAECAELEQQLVAMQQRLLARSKKKKRGKGQKTGGRSPA